MLYIYIIYIQYMFFWGVFFFKFSSNFLCPHLQLKITIQGFPQKIVHGGQNGIFLTPIVSARVLPHRKKPNQQIFKSPRQKEDR